MAAPHVMEGALSGVKVLELSNFLAAPMSTMFMADFGADVLKVEQPGKGDEVRYWGENRNGVGLYYKVLNRGKKSVTLDLRTPLGVEAVKRLAADVDLVVENYRTGTLEKWGIGYETLRAVNPGLVMMRITGYGQTGPYSDRPGFGTLAEAYAGYAHISGYPDDAPLLPGFGLADSTTGLMAAFLALVALNERRRSGRGQYVDLAIYETLLTLIGPHVVNYDQLGIVQQRAGSRLPFTAPRNTYRTRDGKWVTIGGSAQSAFINICETLGIPDLVRDPRFSDNRQRLRNVQALDDAIQAAVSRFGLAELLARSEERRCTMSPVNDVAQIMADPHIRSRENIRAVFDEELGCDLRMQDVVGKLSASPGAIRHPGPRLGQHNREILVERLGYSEATLAEAGITLDLPPAAEPPAL
ncbi:CaiB/BaiF CoA transferase family protein [Bordetella flabilis]|nr:CaiB/BaiF CoA-transferase family protein [Bordetella flabilis]